MRGWRFVFLFMAGLILASQPANQTAIDGFVLRDVTGPVPGTKVGLDSLTKGFHRETLTDAAGYYLFNQLEPGGYSVWAEVKGHGCIVYPNIVATLGQRARRDFYFGRAKHDLENCAPPDKKSK